MNEADALGLVQSTIWTIVVTSGPAVVAAMVVGIVVALFQALTQIQEMTLTFVPKIIAILVVLSLSRLFHRLADVLFTEQVYARIERATSRRRAVEGDRPRICGRAPLAGARKPLLSPRQRTAS